jgi:hypothetical protein
MRFVPVLLLSLLAASSAEAAMRAYGVTSFDKIRVLGPVSVVLHSGSSASAKAEGDQRAVDKLRVEVRGTTLVIDVDNSNWSGTTMGPDTGRAKVTVFGPGLAAASVEGSGDLSIDTVKVGTFTLTVSGPGSAAVTTLAADKLFATVAGSGSASVAGQAKETKLSAIGTARIDAGQLKVLDAEVNVSGAGSIDLVATRTAKVSSVGSGSVHVSGNPACSVSNRGAGEAYCGN